MQVMELKDALRKKIREFELALEFGKSRKELSALYKELKELQYQLTLLEAAVANTQQPA